MLKRIIQSPYLNLISGLVLLATAGYETWKSLDEGVGAHHGVLVFSVIHIVKLLPEFMHGLKEVDEADEGLKKKASAA